MKRMAESTYFHAMNNDAIPRGLSFLAGAAAGLALGYYLHSEKGQSLKAQLGEKWGDAFDDLGEYAREHLGDLLKTLSGTLEQGINFAEVIDNQFRENLSEVAENAGEALEDAETSFESGMDKAKNKLMKKFAEAGL